MGTSVALSAGKTRVLFVFCVFKGAVSEANAGIPVRVAFPLVAFPFFFFFLPKIKTSSVVVVVVGVSNAPDAGAQTRSNTLRRSRMLLWTTVVPSVRLRRWLSFEVGVSGHAQLSTTRTGTEYSCSEAQNQEVDIECLIRFPCAWTI